MKLKLKYLSLFHLNKISSSKNFDDFNHLINDLNLDFNILVISGSIILKCQSLKINISSQNYVIEQTLQNQR